MKEQDLPAASFYKDVSPQGPTMFHGLLTVSHEVKGAITLVGIYGGKLSSAGEMLCYQPSVSSEKEGDFEWLVNQLGTFVQVFSFIPEGRTKKIEYHFILENGEKKALIMIG